MDFDLCSDIEWFKRAEIDKLLAEFAPDLDSERRTALHAYVNDCVHHFLSEWSTQCRPSNTAIAKKLASIEGHARKLRDLLNTGEVMTLLSVGAQTKVEKAWTNPLDCGVDDIMDEAHHLIYQLPTTLGVVLDAAAEARAINDGRKSRTKRNRSQHEANESFDGLIEHLLDAWKDHLGQKVTYTLNAANETPTATIRFLRACLETISMTLERIIEENKIPLGKEDKKMIRRLSSDESALRECGRRIPDRIARREEYATRRNAS